jgi:hypothetical protein
MTIVGLDYWNAEVEQLLDLLTMMIFEKCERAERYPVGPADRHRSFHGQQTIIDIGFTLSYHNLVDPG